MITTLKGELIKLRLRPPPQKQNSLRFNLLTPQFTAFRVGKIFPISTISCSKYVQKNVGENLIVFGS